MGFSKVTESGPQAAPEWGGHSIFIDGVYRAWEDIDFPERVQVDPEKAAREIWVREDNISLRYRFLEGDVSPPPEGSFPGVLELELRSLSGEPIDTITIGKLSPVSLGRILDAVMDVDAPAHTYAMSNEERSFLPQTKLREILTTAEEHGATVVTALGRLPEQVASSYYEQLRMRPSEDSTREQMLRANDPVVSASLLPHGFALARSLAVTKVLIQTDMPFVMSEVRRLRTDQKIVWVMRERPGMENESGDLYLESQNSRLDQDTQVRLALFSALMKGFVRLDDRVLCFSGSSNDGHLNSLSVYVPGRLFSWLSPESLNELQSFPAAGVFERVLNLAIRFAVEGLEGDRIGATFVIGRLEELDPYLTQKIRNPWHGYPPEECSIVDGSLRESLREYANTDGAVIIDQQGRIARSGTYFTVSTDQVPSREDWGARHRTAAALSAVTDAAVIVVSHSGKVSVMWNGRPILEVSGE